jgi:hypothetical protein
MTMSSDKAGKDANAFIAPVEQIMSVEGWNLQEQIGVPFAMLQMSWA